MHEIVDVNVLLCMYVDLVLMMVCELKCIFMKLWGI